MTEPRSVDAQVADEHFVVGQVFVGSHDRAVRARDLGRGADVRQVGCTVRDAAGRAGGGGDRQIVTPPRHHHHRAGCVFARDWPAASAS